MDLPTDNVANEELSDFFDLRLLASLGRRDETKLSKKDTAREISNDFDKHISRKPALTDFDHLLMSRAIRTWLSIPRYRTHSAKHAVGPKLAIPISFARTRDPKAFLQLLQEVPICRRNEITLIVNHFASNPQDKPILEAFLGEIAKEGVRIALCIREKHFRKEMHVIDGLLAGQPQETHDSNSQPQQLVHEIFLSGGFLDLEDRSASSDRRFKHLTEEHLATLQKWAHDPRVWLSIESPQMGVLQAFADTHVLWTSGGAAGRSYQILRDSVENGSLQFCPGVAATSFLKQAPLPTLLISYMTLRGQFSPEGLKSVEPVGPAQTPNTPIPTFE